VEWGFMGSNNRRSPNLDFGQRDQGGRSSDDTGGANYRLYQP
jgi:hypothetical protein